MVAQGRPAGDDRSANREAAAHFAKGLELVASLPASDMRLRQELQLWTAMGSALIPAKGWADPEACRRFQLRGGSPNGSGTMPNYSLPFRGESACRTISGDLRAAEGLGPAVP